jgi:hypothetical protein
MVPLRLNRAFVAGKVVHQSVDAVARTDLTAEWQHEEETIGSEWVLSTYHIRLHDGNLVCRCDHPISFGNVQDLC